MKRKQFNFYYSYWEIAKELNKDDRIAFYDALMLRQFTGIETELKGIAKLAYISQKFNIDSQIKGWEDKMNMQLIDNHPTKGGSVQEKGEGKGEGKEKEETIDVSAKAEKIDFEKLKDFINQKTGRSFKLVNKQVQGKYLARLKEGYTKDDIMNAIKNAVKNQFHIDNNFQHLTPEFFSRAEKLDKYSNTNNKPKEKNVNKSLIPKGVSYSGPQY